MIQRVIDQIEIPEDIAKELSDLLVKQVVRERVLLASLSDPVKFEEAEKLVLPITEKIEAMKTRITQSYIPEKYNDSKYIWNYNGYAVSQNKIEIIESV